MVTIKIKNKKIKVFNLLLLIIIFAILIYLIGKLFFLLPIFKSKYSYKINKENYSIKVTAIFKRNVLSCNLKEEYKVNVEDNDIKEKLYSDLRNDGFKLKKDNIFIRNNKSFSLCKKVKKNYKKYHNTNYLDFKLNGNNNIVINYGSDYKDEYVKALINNKEVKNINMNSNLNLNKLGKYIITYSLDITDNYKQRLYRKVNVIDSEKPVITLQGDEKIVLDYNSKYVELGFTATDNYDGDITNKVSVKNTVNEKKKGTYKVTYKVSDSSNNKDKKERIVIVKDKAISVNKEESKIEAKDGITYVNGILIVNKKYGLPSNYNPGVNPEASSALKKMQADASAIGLNLKLVSGFRSYERQENLYNSYLKKDGKTKADTYSAMTGHSEHQTGLAFDIGRVNESFSNTSESKWLEENAHLYGFIIRYPKGKTSITGYIYEPWHVRYLGVDIATDVKNSGLCLEEYLGIN